jgi:S-adenosylmethionine:tRNA ribosyltransferase-isomerase
MAFAIAPQSEDQHLSAYDYPLPSERIAQNPAVPRDHSRLLVVDTPHSHQDQQFYELPQWLRSGDLLVLNNTQVIPARLHGHKLLPESPRASSFDHPETLGVDLGDPTSLNLGCAVEILLLEEQEHDRWLTLVKPGRRLKPGSKVICFQGHEPSPGSPRSWLLAHILATHEPTGGRIVQFYPPPGVTFWQGLSALGEIPLPPYITGSQAQPDQYQTVYSSEPGAVAAPTAGLHFTPQLLQRLTDQGIDQAFITLHVGLGTFRPVETDDIHQHTMHSEWIEVPPATVAKIQATQAQGGRVIAVGTTVVRALEGASQEGSLQPYQGKVNLFISPGYQWRTVEGLITNFHLPRSSLTMLVSALVGRQRLLDLYHHAIAAEYRFYSFGDAMLILPDARPGA